MNIVNPIDNNQYSIFSKTGRTLLKLYLRNFKNGGKMEDGVKLTVDDMRDAFMRSHNSTNLVGSVLYPGLMNEVHTDYANEHGLLPPFANPTETTCDETGLCWTCDTHDGKRICY